MNRGTRLATCCVLSVASVACTSPVKPAPPAVAPPPVVASAAPPATPATSLDASMTEPPPPPPLRGSCVDTTPPMGMPTQVVRHQGRLFVVADDGSLTSFDKDDSEYRRELVGEHTMAVHRPHDGDLWALSEETASHPAHVRRLHGGEWTPAFEVPLLASDHLIALGEQHGEAVLVLDTAVIILGPGHDPRRVPLASPLPRGLLPALGITDAGFLYVGVDAGEWGGGLRRIRLATGAVENVERRDSTALCAGPLDTSCDPVTSVVVDRRTPDCVWAGVGLSHMGMHQGRVLRVCGGRVEVDFQRTIEDRSDGDGGRVMTEPVTGLTAKGDGYLASTSGGTYEVHRGEGVRLPRKEPVERCGLLIAELAPGAVAVFSTIHNRLSVSGAMPLLASDAR